MKRLICAVSLIVLTSTFVLASEPDRNELVSSPQFVDKVAEPTFIDLDPEQLKEQLKVVSSRSYAVFGFNNPGVELFFPRCDNNVYAIVEFSPARLLDDRGDDVEYERERGIFDYDTHSDELRFAPLERDTLVEYARAEGTITLRYPVRMRTVVIKPGDSAPDGLTIDLDGPFVTWSDPKERLPEAASFVPVKQLRAIDASGRQLKQHNYRGFSMSAGVTTEKYAYWGEVAEVRIDTVEEWAELEISYSLPPLETFPDEQAGTAPEKDMTAATPGGKIEIRIVGQRQSATQVSSGTISKDEAMAQLAALGFRHFDANSFILAATRGKTDALRLFLAAGMPVDSESGGRTALLMAATMGHVEAGKMLIEAGADVNQKDATGSPPLLRAVMQCKASELVQVLIDAGADLSVSYLGGTPVVEVAKATGCTETVKILTAAGLK
jgi:hypothetical protein